MSSNKGAKIRFTAGSYSGQAGWYDISKGLHPTKSYYVIVTLEDGNEKSTLVRRTSVVDGINNEQETVYERAVLKQHPDIEAVMEKLAKMLAECDVSDTSGEIQKIMTPKLTSARATQQMHGHKANWRNVEWAEL